MANVRPMLLTGEGSAEPATGPVTLGCPILPTTVPAMDASGHPVP